MRWYLTKGDSWWMAIFDAEGGVEITKEDGSSESLQFLDTQAAAKAVRERVAVLMADDYNETTHPDDKYRPDPTIDAWFHEEFFALLAASKREQSRNLVSALEADRHVTFPPDVRAFLQFRDTHNFGYTNFAEWRIWDQDLELPDMGTDNRFEQLILMDQQNYLGTAMNEAFMNAVYLGSAGNGDSYFVAQAEDKDDYEVIYWNHESAQPEFAIADRISTFAFANHLLNEVDEFDISDQMALIEERAHLSWHYSSIEEESGIEPSYERRGNSMYYFWRTSWVDYLLRNNQVVKLSSIPDYFLGQIHQGLTWEEVLKFNHIRETPPTQYYWLWRLFWFNKPELAQMLEIAANAPSPLVRDCAALIAELQNGRKTLGTIADIHTLREQFIALDLDPDPARVAEREQEKIAAEKAAEQARQTALSEVHALTKSASREELIDAAWGRIDNLEAVEVIYDHLKSHDDIAWGIRRVEFLGDSSNEAQKYEICEILGERGSAVMPLVLAKCGYTIPLRVSRYASDRRCLPMLVAALSGERFRQFAAYAVGELVATHHPELAGDVLPALRQLAEDSWWEDGDYLAAINHKDSLKASVWALGQLGIPKDLDFLLKTASEGPEPCQIAAAKAATELTIRHGLASDALEEILSNLLQSENPNPALFLLARLATDHAAQIVEAHLAVQGGTDVAMAYANVMKAALALRRGEPVSWQKALFAAQVSCENVFEEEELHLTLMELLGAHQDPDAVEEILRRFAGSPLPTVRRRAQTLLTAFEYVAFPADAVVVEDVFEAEGFVGLTRLLEDPDTSLRHKR